MTIKETKKEIVKLLEQIPEESLPRILAYLQELKELGSKNVKRGQNFIKIIEEDRELLKRLAQ